MVRYPDLVVGNKRIKNTYLINGEIFDSVHIYEGQYKLKVMPFHHTWFIFDRMGWTLAHNGRDAALLDTTCLIVRLMSDVVDSRMAVRRLVRQKQKAVYGTPNLLNEKPRLIF